MPEFVTGSARGIAERLLEWSGIAFLSARRRSGATLVLSYHNIAPDSIQPAGDRSLHLRRGEFSRQLDYLASHVDVIPLATILDPVAVGARPRVAITFDDAYRGALTLGAAELKARNMPATMFVPPGLLGADAFWWDAFAQPGGLPPEWRHAALDDCRGDGAMIHDEWVRLGRLPVTVPGWMQPGTLPELLSWVRDGGTVGAHTWAHVNLRRAGPLDLERELVQPLAWLRDHLPAPVVLPWLSYPYGLADAAVAKAAKNAGYQAAMLVSGGWLPRVSNDPYALPRLNIPAGLSIRGFRLRMAGLMGAAVAHAQQDPLAG
jgi:peptidoglycan/xylan/chitin deacetylase (PgdA/CDA1 family)